MEVISYQNETPIYLDLMTDDLLCIHNEKVKQLYSVPSKWILIYDKHNVPLPDKPYFNIVDWLRDFQLKMELKNRVSTYIDRIDDTGLSISLNGLSYISTFKSDDIDILFVQHFFTETYRAHLRYKMDSNYDYLSEIRFLKLGGYVVQFVFNLDNESRTQGRVSECSEESELRNFTVSLNDLYSILYKLLLCGVEFESEGKKVVFVKYSAKL